MIVQPRRELAPRFPGARSDRPGEEVRRARRRQLRGALLARGAGPAPAPGGCVPWRRGPPPPPPPPPLGAGGGGGGRRGGGGARAAGRTAVNQLRLAIAWTVLSVALGARPAWAQEKKPPEPLPKDVVAAWQRAGAKVGWMELKAHGTLGFFKE